MQLTVKYSRASAILGSLAMAATGWCQSASTIQLPAHGSVPQGPVIVLGGIESASEQPATVTLVSTVDDDKKKPDVKHIVIEVDADIDAGIDATDDSTPSDGARIQRKRVRVTARTTDEKSPVGQVKASAVVPATPLRAAQQRTATDRAPATRSQPRSKVSTPPVRRPQVKQNHSDHTHAEHDARSHEHQPHTHPAPPPQPGQRMMPPVGRMPMNQAKPGAPGREMQARISALQQRAPQPQLNFKQHTEVFEAVLESGVVKHILELTTKNIELQAEMKILESRVDAEARIHELEVRHAMESAERALHEAKSMREDIEGDWEDLQDERDDLEREMDAVNGHRENAERQMAEARQMAKEAEHLVRQAHEGGGAADRFKQEINELRSMLEREVMEKRRIQEAAEREIAAAHAHAHNDAPSANHKKFEAIVSELKKQNAELKAKNADLTEYAGKMKGISGDMESVKKWGTEMRAKLEADAKIKAELEHRARLLESRLKEMEKKLAESQKSSSQGSSARRRGDGAQNSREAAEKRKREEEFIRRRNQESRDADWDKAKRAAVEAKKRASDRSRNPESKK